MADRSSRPSTTQPSGGFGGGHAPGMSSRAPSTPTHRGPRSSHGSRDHHDVRSAHLQPEEEVPLLRGRQPLLTRSALQSASRSHHRQESRDHGRDRTRYEPQFANDDDRLAVAGQCMLTHYMLHFGDRVLIHRVSGAIFHLSAWGLMTPEDQQMMLQWTAGQSPPRDDQPPPGLGYASTHPTTSGMPTPTRSNMNATAPPFQPGMMAPPPPPTASSAPAQAPAPPPPPPAPPAPPSAPPPPAPSAPPASAASTDTSIAMTTDDDDAVETFETYENDPAMLVLSYGSDFPMGSRFNLSTYEVLGAYHSCAVTDPTFPTVMSNGIHAVMTGFGPWTLYCMGFDMATKFASKFPKIVVDSDGNTHEDVTLDVKARRVLQTSSTALATGPSYAPVNSALPSTFIQEETGFIEVHLENGEQFHFLHKSDIQSAIHALGVTVYRSKHVEHKMPENDDDLTARDKWIPMGTSNKSQVVNATVKPTDTSMLLFEWPAHLIVHKQVAIGAATTNRTYHVAYRLGGGCIKDVFHSSRDGCKKILPAAYERHKDKFATVPTLCSCNSSAPSLTQRDPAIMQRREAGIKRKREISNGLEAFAAKFAEKNQTPCSHFIDGANKGMCKSGKKCRLLHPGVEAAWATIQCGRRELGVSDRGWCDAGTNCCYSPCVHEGRRLLPPPRRHE